MGRGALSTSNTLEEPLGAEQLPGQMLALNGDGARAGYESREDAGLDGVVDHLRIS